MAPDSTTLDWQRLGATWGIEIGAATGERLTALATWIAERGLPLGLTNYPSSERVAEHHLAPILAVARLPGFPPGGRVLDLGAGGGALGLTLAVLYPSLNVLLADRRRRSATFINLAIARIGIHNAQARQVEAGLLAKTCPGQFEMVGVRALAHAPEVLRLCAPLLSASGWVAAWHQSEDAAFLNPPSGWERTATRETALAGLSVSQLRRSTPVPA